VGSWFQFAGLAGNRGPNEALFFSCLLGVIRVLSGYAFDPNLETHQTQETTLSRTKAKSAKVARHLLFPVPLSFAVDMISRVFKMLVHFPSVTLVPNFEDHLNTRIAKRCKPDGALMIYFHVVRSAFGN